MFLWMLGGPQSFTRAEDRFIWSTETIYRKFKHVLQCVYYLGGDIIKATDPKVHPVIRDKRFWPHFKGCIGAIDGSHVPIVVPAKETLNYTRRHGYTSQKVLAICDFGMRFTFVVASWAGSFHDNLIFNHSTEKYETTYPAPPQGITIPYLVSLNIELYAMSD
jgi:hypothetical protein